MTSRIIAPLLIAAALLTAPHTAGADMQLGFQGDGTIVDGQGIGRTASLDLIQGAGGEWVRVIVYENDWNQRSGQYLDTVAAIKGRGLNVMVTLARWRGLQGTERPGVTISDWAEFAYPAVSTLGPYVDAWGTTNEPNFAGFSPATATTCALEQGVRSEDRLLIVKGKHLVVRYKRVGRGKGSWKRTVQWRKVGKGGTHKRVGTRYARAAKRGQWAQRATFSRKHGGPYKRIVRRLRKHGKVTVSTPFEQRVCAQQARAAAYRPIHDLTARIIRHYDPTSTVIVGEIAPAAGSFAFMDAFFAAGNGTIDADALGVHPYGTPHGQGDASAFVINNIEATVNEARRWQAQGKMSGGRMWITEYGVRPDQPVAHWTDALTRAEQAGVPVMILYELTQHVDPDHFWDTALLNSDGSPRPAWHAVSGWLANS